MNMNYLRESDTTGEAVQVGEAVGIIDAQSIGEPGIHKILKGERVV